MRGKTYLPDVVPEQNIWQLRLGRSVSVSSVRWSKFLLGNVEEGITKPEIPKIQRMQCVFQRQLQKLLCKILLQRRMYGEFL